MLLLRQDEWLVERREVECVSVLDGAREWTESGAKKEEGGKEAVELF